MVVDLRSDTVTRPTKEMMDAMLSAKVGDDVFEEDPTVVELENLAAGIFGHEAGIYCPSGTMTNQIAIRLHTQIGSEVICDKLCHIYNYEGGGVAVNSGASVRLLEGDRGRFTADMVAGNINPDDVHFPRTSVVAVENTCNKGGGSCYDLGELKNIGAVCKENGLGYHLDGARTFNALVEKGYDPKEYGQLFDTISICLSKGLGAPIGSVLLGSKEWIKEARRVRKVLGGGMRQVGILAAAGIYSLNNNVERLSQDHARARILGEEAAKLPFVAHVLPVDTNIVVVELNDQIKDVDLIAKLKEKDIIVVPFGAGKVRMVTHLDINDDKLDYAITELKKIA